MKPAAVSRADLLRCLDAAGADRLPRLAAALGWEPLPESAPEPDGQTCPDGSGTTARDATPASPTAASSPDFTSLAVTARELLAPLPDAAAPPTGTPAPPDPQGPLPTPPPLMPWSRLWPFLRAALGARVERHRLDQPRTVAALSRLRPLRRLPRLRACHWAGQGQLVLDLSPRLYPFWNDFAALRDLLLHLRGAGGLTVLRLDQGPDGPVRRWDGRGWGPPGRYTPPPPGAPLVIAGDLGCLDPDSALAAWKRFGRARASEGCRPVALTPCPPRWWQPALARWFFPVVLDRGAAPPPAPRGPRP